MTFSTFANIRLPEDSKSTPISYDQLFNSDNEATSEKTPSSHEFKNLIVTYSEYTKDNDMRWRKNTHSDGDSLNWRKNMHNVDDDRYRSTYRQVLETGFTTFQKDSRMLYDKDPIISNNPQKGDRSHSAMQTNQNYHLYKELKRQTDVLENQYLSFSKFVRAPVDGRSRDPRKMNGRYKKKDPYTLYREFKRQQQLRSGRYNEEYERDMELLSEITYSALKRQIAMSNDKETKDPQNLYKTLNRKFKKSNTEDFFRDPVAACVEVLEYISAWIAEKLSLPPPDPVNHDLVIYKREDKTNYSFLAAVVKNKKVQFLVSQGVPFNDSESLGYMFLNQ